MQYGDRIGFYVFDKTKSAADTSAKFEYDCGVTANELKGPLLSISPSHLLNNSHPSVTIASSPTPARSPYFGGLGKGRYKLCYCVRPVATASNPDQECRPTDFKYSAGVYFFYDVPGNYTLLLTNTTTATAASTTTYYHHHHYYHYYHHYYHYYC